MIYRLFYITFCHVGAFYLELYLMGSLIDQGRTMAYDRQRWKIKKKVVKTNQNDKKRQTFIKLITRLSKTNHTKSRCWSQVLRMGSRSFNFLNSRHLNSLELFYIYISMHEHILEIFLSNICFIEALVICIKIIMPIIHLLLGVFMTDCRF